MLINSWLAIEVSVQVQSAVNTIAMAMGGSIRLAMTAFAQSNQLICLQRPSADQKALYTLPARSILPTDRLGPRSQQSCSSL